MLTDDVLDKPLRALQQHLLAVEPDSFMRSLM